MPLSPYLRKQSTVSTATVACAPSGMDLAMVKAPLKGPQETLFPHDRVCRRRRRLRFKVHRDERLDDFLHRRPLLVRLEVLLLDLLLLFVEEVLKVVVIDAMLRVDDG